MVPQFIRVRGKDGDAEIFINLSTISRMEVRYAVKDGESGPPFYCGVEEGMKNDQAIRFYRVFVGDVEFNLGANPNIRVMQALEAIYKNAIRDA
jgi:hypothetical protein